MKMSVCLAGHYWVALWRNEWIDGWMKEREQERTSWMDASDGGSASVRTNEGRDG